MRERGNSVADGGKTWVYAICYGGIPPADSWPPRVVSLWWNEQEARAYAEAMEGNWHVIAVMVNGERRNDGRQE